MHPERALREGMIPDRGWVLGRESPGSLHSDEGRIVLQDTGAFDDLEDLQELRFASRKELAFAVITAVDSRSGSASGNSFVHTVGALLGDEHAPGSWQLIPNSQGEPNRLAVDTGCLAVVPLARLGWLRSMRDDVGYADALWDRITSRNDQVSEVLDGIGLLRAEPNMYDCWGKFEERGLLSCMYLDLLPSP